MGVVTHPPISTAAPKHAGYLGSLRIDLRLKRCMQSQGRREQAASCNLENNNKHIRQRNIQNRESTMSVEELLVGAVV